MDWVNLQKILVYKIKKVPSPMVFLDENAYHPRLMEFFEAHEAEFTKKLSKEDVDQLKGELKEENDKLRKDTLEKAKVKCLDFVNGSFWANPYSKWLKGEKASASSPSSMTPKMNLTIVYRAEFPGRIISAEIGGRAVKHGANSLNLTLEDLSNVGKGELKITVVKKLSPLGVYTWVVLGLIAVGVIILGALAVWQFFLKH